MLLDIPVELRLLIYDIYLEQIQRIVNGCHPSNIHYSLLHTCRQISAEAEPLLRQYISLRNERQIRAFIFHGQQHLAQVRWADVASDGRVIDRASETGRISTPVSVLYLALRKMSSLQTLRVFECRQGFDIKERHIGSQVRSRVEWSMFPLGAPVNLSSYEIHLAAETKIIPFTAIRSSSLQKLRLTGQCQFSNPPSQNISTPISQNTFPSLEQLTMVSITGNYFDKHGFGHYFPEATKLHTFIYKQGHTLGFEIRDHHLTSLTDNHGAHLRKLVILGCSRPGSATIAHCLRNLPVLEYFALSLVTVSELRENFVLAIPSTVVVLKLAVRQAWYALRLIDEERVLCEGLEHHVLRGSSPPQEIFVDFYDQLMDDDRRSRWVGIAKEARFTLNIGTWDIDEQV